VFTILKIEIGIKYTIKMQLNAVKEVKKKLNAVKNYIVFKHLFFYYSSCEESFGIRCLVCCVYTTNEYVGIELL
jgi:hypothetical protein